MNYIVTIRFKDKNKVFRGKTYDYILFQNEDIPKVGDIIRMLDQNYEYICYGTRVRVEQVRLAEVDINDYISIHYIEDSLED